MFCLISVIKLELKWFCTQSVVLAKSHVRGISSRMALISTATHMLLLLEEVPQPVIE